MCECGKGWVEGVMLKKLVLPNTDTVLAFE